MKKNIICIFFWFVAVSALAQNSQFQVRHLVNEQELPHQQVEALLQDASGNIWIGTRNGLACYNGYSIRNYYHEEGNPNSIKHNFIHKLFQDRSNNIWIMSETGLCRYNPETDSFKSYDSIKERISSVVQMQSGKILCGGSQLYVYDPQQDRFDAYPSLDNSYILSMAVDARDNLIIVTNATIYSYDPTLTNIGYPYSDIANEFLTGADGIAPLFYDSKGRMWIGRNGHGVMCVNKDGSTETYEPTDISNGIVRCISENLHGDIWLGTEKGITVILANGNIEIIRSSFDNDSMISDNAIYSILCDKNDNIWIGSYFGGVDLLQKGSLPFNVIKPGFTAKNIHGKAVRSMVETNEGMFWIATEDGGLNIYDSHNGEFYTFTGIPNIGTNVHSLYFDKETNVMWIGTFRNGLFKYDINRKNYSHYLTSNGHNLSSVFNIARRKNGSLWVATTLGLFKYDEKNDGFIDACNGSFEYKFIYSLCADKQGNLWVGTSAFGLFCIHENGKISNWTTDGKSNIKEKFITCIFQDSKGVIWFGTNNNGVQYVENDEIHSLQNGILSEKTCVCSINEDRNGLIWISTSHGLYRYDRQKKQMQRFTMQDGLPTNQFNFSSSLQASNGDMFFGTVNGMVRFTPSKMSIPSTPLTVHLFELAIKNMPVTVGTENSPLTKILDETDEITLSYDEASSFSLEFGVIMPGKNQNVEYQIWVEGIDKTWHNTGKERRFSGYKLSPGTYIVHIRANDNSRSWNECTEKVIVIKVRPPFYRSTLAYIIYLLVLCLLAYIAYRISATRLREKNIARMATMEKEKLEQLDKAKFDFFTSVSHELKTPLSLIVAPLKVLSKEELSSDGRTNLDIAIKNTKKMEGLINELVTFNKIETDQFPFYVQKGNPLDFTHLVAQTFQELAKEKSLILSIETENNGEDVWFSPSYVERILNNLLSNAIKFTSEGGTVSVRSAIVTNASDHYTYLCIKVSDTGIGIAPEERENIFGRYYQTKRGYNVNNSGWGIGLSLVKRLTDVHKGNIELDSELGKGSTFTIMLNVSADAFPKSSYITDDKVIVPISEYKLSKSMSELADNSNIVNDNQNGSDGKLKILIVDDNSDLLSFLRSYFSNNYHVLTATNGREALEIAGNEQIQLVVSDVMMPEMDGVELCKALKEDMQTSHIPVILLTAKSEPDDVVAGYKSGAEAYVSKPFEPEILELQIKNIISLQKQRQTEIINSPDPEVTTTDLSSIDREFIRKINEVIEKNIANSDFSISDITEDMCISRSLLHLKMKSLTAVSTGDYVRKKRLDRSCEILKDTHSVADAAYKTGFSDPNYFSKVFKKVYGINPSEYINNKK